MALKKNRIIRKDGERDGEPLAFGIIIPVFF
jgi:hypothetical protein